MSLLSLETGNTRKVSHELGFDIYDSLLFRLFIFGGSDSNIEQNTLIYEFIEDSSDHWQQRGQMLNSLHHGYVKIDYIPKLH